VRRFRLTDISDEIVEKILAEPGSDWRNGANNKAVVQSLKLPKAQ
jgi:hypothetical protein